MDAFVRGVQGGLTMSEQRLIDANALLKRLKEIHYMDGIKMRLEVEYAPTIDPVRHGKWEFCSQDIYGMSGYFKCSACYSMLPTDHSRTNYKQKVPFDYCPNCGAKMDKE